MNALIFVQLLPHNKHSMCLHLLMICVILLKLKYSPFIENISYKFKSWRINIHLIDFFNLIKFIRIYQLYITRIICSDATRIATNVNSHHSSNIKWKTDLNVNDNEDELTRNPLPVTRKMTNSMNNGINHSNLELFKEESLDKSTDNVDEPKIDDYCKPKISNSNNH